VPFGREPVFVTTRQLSVSAFAGTLRTAQIRGLKLFTFSAQPFTQPGLAFPAVKVFLNNGDTRHLAGTLDVKGEWGDNAPGSSVRFSLSPGQIQILKVDLKRSIRRPDGLYPFCLTANTRFGKQELQVAIPTAIVWPVTCRADGALAEWEKYPGVPLGQDVRDGPMVWAGADERWLYVAVKVEEPEPESYWSGELTPASVRKVLAGTSVQIALGFGERSPDACHDPDDPWYWKGMIRDTDYLFGVAPTAPDAATIFSLHEPGMIWGESLLRGAKEVPSAKVAVRRNGTTCVYEAAIPRRGLSGFEKGAREFRLGFVVKSAGRTYQLAERCGVPACLASGGSFLPAEDDMLLPNQVWWGRGR
jgi:hypothetical protein